MYSFTHTISGAISQADSYIGTISIVHNINPVGNNEGGGTSNHSELDNLEYANSGHTGFQPAKGADELYVSSIEKTTWNNKLSEESDPVFTASQAANITSGHITVLNNTSGTNTGDQTVPVKNTGSEINTGTDDDKFTTAKSLADSKYNTFEIPYALDSQTSDATSGTKITDYFAFAFSMASIRCNLAVAASGGVLFTIDIKNNGTSIFTTKITFDAGEATINDPATPYVLVNNPTTWAVNDKLEIIIDSIGSSTAGKGPIIYLIGTKI